MRVQTGKYISKLIRNCVYLQRYINHVHLIEINKINRKYDIYNLHLIEINEINRKYAIKKKQDDYLK